MALKTVHGAPAGPHKGRGATDNPEGRFERVEREAFDDGWETSIEDDPSRPRTTVTAERARGIVTRNQSPDVPFNLSINPYRGCEHGCVYCMSGDSAILMADGRTRMLADIRPGDVVYGTRRKGWYRRYVASRVLAHWRTIKAAYRIVLEDGTQLISGGDHRFLTEHGWKYVTPVEPGSQRRRPGLIERQAAPPRQLIRQRTPQRIVWLLEELGLDEVRDLPDAALRDPIYLRTGDRSRSRDGCRVPLPWSGERSPFGFNGTGKAPWLPQPDSWAGRTVAAQRGDPVDFALQGEWKELPHLAREIMDKMAASGMVHDIDSDYRPGMAEMQILPDRNKLAMVNMTTGHVADSMSLLVGGQRRRHRPGDGQNRS